MCLDNISLSLIAAKRALNREKQREKRATTTKDNKSIKQQKREIIVDNVERIWTESKMAKWKYTHTQKTINKDKQNEEGKKIHSAKARKKVCDRTNAMLVVKKEHLMLWKIINDFGVAYNFCSTCPKGVFYCWFYDFYDFCIEYIPFCVCVGNQNTRIVLAIQRL